MLPPSPKLRDTYAPIPCQRHLRLNSEKGRLKSQTAQIAHTLYLNRLSRPTVLARHATVPCNV